MKNLIEKIIQFRNPEFYFDPDIPLNHVLDLFLFKTISFIRSFKLMFRGKLPILIFLGQNVKFKALKNIVIGKWVNIGSYSTLSSYGRNTSLFIGNNVNIGNFSSLVVSHSLSNLGKSIIIEDNVGIGDYCHIGGAGGVLIKKDTIIGPYFSCHSSNHQFNDLSKLIRLQETKRIGIIIGKNCWIGAKVTILDGVIIGDGCVVAAGSVVNKEFESNCVIGGVPAKIIKRIS